MAEPVDILDEKDPIAFPFVGSVLAHTGIVAILFFGWFWMNQRRDILGDKNAGGGPAYTVSPVHNIPIPQREAPPNPVANDTQSLVPNAPAKQETQKKEPPPKNAFEIAEKKKHPAEKPQQQQHYQQPTPPNQVFSHNRPALSNPMYSSAAGSGQVGVGPNTPLGDNRLGWYANLIRDRIAQNWNTNGLDSRSQSSPAIISFIIMRDGTVRDPRIVQSSGSPAIDDSALRAVYSAGQLPPLPGQISESYITAQFTFNLR